MMYHGENIQHPYRTNHTSHDTPLVEFCLKAEVEPPMDFKSAVRTSANHRGWHGRAPCRRSSQLPRSSGAMSRVLGTPRQRPGSVASTRSWFIVLLYRRPPPAGTASDHRTTKVIFSTVDTVLPPKVKADMWSARMTDCAAA